MRFEDSPYSKSIQHKKVILDFGSYYLCDNFFIMEVNEGEHFNWNKLGEVLISLRAHYGHHKTLAYIANRVNAYSIDPVLWSYFDKDDSILVAASIVSYRDSTFINANIEKQLASIPIKRALSLDEAIDWVQKLSEFN
ncbi:hypothetical protein [Winogradskyella sp. SYSU M77433]|uniref:hypothetical protein n=1 Tax=Winogradskyella sp. SYSU M77433 TaxID=3042722 RepID=UPI00248008C9|nr:hypothetical protein [Winogradskyella sp. SYSU M77433]MDH7912680.1 hypothetical protein [Winogradskyella sp. SYSU M77433]|tara:strand:- start:922 stop:1335 length:414 start_codon:yes stop_codon:yes gene_type:complete